jgi:hypothetical protein
MMEGSINRSRRALCSAALLLSLSSVAFLPTQAVQSQTQDGIEDKAILTREYAAMTSEKPKLVYKATTEKLGFTREIYEVTWRAQDLFYLYIIRPVGVEKPPVILFLPTFPEDVDSFKNDTWCQSAARGGYAMVGFIGAVTGHRFHGRPLKQWFVSEMPEALSTTTHDVQLILDYLSSRGDFDLDRVGMYGVGSGGSVAVLASVVDSRIRVVNVLGLWGDWPSWLAESKIVPEERRVDYLKPEFLANVKPLDPVIWLPKMQARSIRIEDVRGNRSIPDSSQVKLEAAAPPFAEIDQYGNGHAFRNAYLMFTQLDWMKDQLKPGAQPQQVAELSKRVHLYAAISDPPANNWPNIAPPPKIANQPVAKGGQPKDDPQ